MKRMTAQGFLVKGAKGEDYLLTTEPIRGAHTHRLVVVKKVNGQWTRVEGVQEVVCREALIGAYVDFVVDLCRVMNSSATQWAAERTSVQCQRLADESETIHDAISHSRQF